MDKLELELVDTKSLLMELSSRFDAAVLILHKDHARLKPEAGPSDDTRVFCQGSPVTCLGMVQYARTQVMLTANALQMQHQDDDSLTFRPNGEEPDLEC